MIRPARAQDAAALADINLRGWLLAYEGFVDRAVMLEAGGLLEERFRALGDPADPRRVLVAEATDGGVRGFVSVGPSRDDDAPADVGELHAIYVDPEAVGTGTGHALLIRGEETLRALGFVAATLWVFERNARARRFYERHGWTVEPGSGPGPWGWARSVRYRRELGA